MPLLYYSYCYSLLCNLNLSSYTTAWQPCLPSLTLTPLPLDPYPEIEPQENAVTDTFYSLFSILIMILDYRG